MSDITVMKVQNILFNKILGISLIACIPILSFMITYHLVSGADWSLTGWGRSENSDKGSVSGISTESVFGADSYLKTYYYAPTKIIADSIGLNLDVVNVGVAGDGSLETPKNWGQAGWYKKGTLAGDYGTVLINAHYDDNYGRPAAFWQLKNLKVGDKVVLLDKLGKTFEYTVTETFLVDINDPNRLDVLDNSDKTSRKLTLITCGGVWIPGKATYNKRLVVQAEI